MTKYWVKFVDHLTPNHFPNRVLGGPHSSHIIMARFKCSKVLNLELSVVDNKQYIEFDFTN